MTTVDFTYDSRERVGDARHVPKSMLCHNSLRLQRSTLFVKIETRQERKSRYLLRRDVATEIRALRLNK